MAATATRTETITFTGDVSGTQSLSAASNPASPAQIDILTLSSGANTITVPTGGSTVKSVTIVPPAGNAQSITLKGVSGDTGIVLHPTDPCTISFDPANLPATFVLTAGATITGLRLIWA